MTAERFVSWFRMAVAVAISAAAIYHAAQIPARTSALLTVAASSAAIVISLWHPRTGVLAFWIALCIAIYSSHFVPLLAVGAVVLVAVCLTHSWAFIVAAWLGWLLFGVLTLQISDGFALWVMTPVILVAVGIAVLIQKVVNRDSEMTAAVRRAIVLFEDEARRQHVILASRLHDEIGHALAKAALISSEGQSSANPEDATHFEGIRRACAEGAEHLGELVAFLREDSGTLDDQESLPSQVLTKLTDTLRSCGFSVTSDQAEGLDHYPELLHPLFNRFLLEATTNALKHSGPPQGVYYEFALAPDSFDIAVRNSVRPPVGEGQGHGLIGLAAAAKRLRCGLAWGAADSEWTLRLVGDLDEVVGEGCLVA